MCPANTPYAGSSLCIRRLASMLCSAGASELSKIGQSPRNHNVFQSVATKSATLSFSHNLRPRIPQKQHYLFWFELSDVAVSRGQYPPLPGIAVHLLEAPATCTGPTTNHAAGLATPRGIGSSTIILSRRNSKRIGPRIFVNKSDSLSSELTFTSLHSLRSLNACTQS